jgi:hypothetical protein
MHVNTRKCCISWTQKYDEERSREDFEMWNVKAKVIPVITGATGTISKSLRKYLSNIPGKHEIKGLQIQSY